MMIENIASNTQEKLIENYTICSLIEDCDSWRIQRDLLQKNIYTLYKKKRNGVETKPNTLNQLNQSIEKLERVRERERERERERMIKNQTCSFPFHKSGQLSLYTIHPPYPCIVPDGQFPCSKPHIGPL